MIVRRDAAGHEGARGRKTTAPETYQWLVTIRRAAPESTGGRRWTGVWPAGPRSDTLRGHDAHQHLPHCSLAAGSAAIPAAEQGTTFETYGVTIWYEVPGGGPGPPLLVANGGPGFDHTYLHCGDCWDRLAKGRKVVFYDQRGNGRSSELQEGQSCTLADQIADLRRAANPIGARRIRYVPRVTSFDRSTSREFESA